MYRMTRATETMEDVRVLANAGRWNACVNRLYYACFYVVSALLVSHGLSSSKHTGVRSLFNQQYVKTGKIPKNGLSRDSRLIPIPEIFPFNDLFCICHAPGRHKRDGQLFGGPGQQHHIENIILARMAPAFKSIHGNRVTSDVFRLDGVPDRRRWPRQTSARQNRHSASPLNDGVLYAEQLGDSRFHCHSRYALFWVWLHSKHNWVNSGVKGWFVFPGTVGRHAARILLLSDDPCPEVMKDAFKGVLA